MGIPILRRLIFSFALIFFPYVTVAAGGIAKSAIGRPALYIRVQLESALRLKGLKPGDAIEGTLSQPVYIGAREVMPAGCPVRLTVDHLEKRRRARNDHWPWIVQVFTPRHENYPIFRSASVTLPGGTQIPLQISFLSIANEREVQAQPRKSLRDPVATASTNAALAPSPFPIATFEATIPGDASLIGSRGEATSDSGLTARETITLESGTQATVILLDTVSASKNHPGDPIEAVLVEPVRNGSEVVLPEGTRFQGKVVDVKRPQWLSRPGALLFTFDNLAWQQGTAGQPVVASVIGAELDRRSHTRIDSEGAMRGGRPGKIWMLVNLGATAGIAKVSDDTLQLIIEAIVSTATDASTAGLGRIVASCVSGAFLATRHGRDVVLPKFTEIRITLNRPLTVPGSPPQPNRAAPNL